MFRNMYFTLPQNQAVKSACTRICSCLFAWKEQCCALFWHHQNATGMTGVRLFLMYNDPYLRTSDIIYNSPTHLPTFRVLNLIKAALEVSVLVTSPASSVWYSSFKGDITIHRINVWWTETGFRKDYDQLGQCTTLLGILAPITPILEVTYPFRQTCWWQLFYLFQ